MSIVLIGAGAALLVATLTGLTARGLITPRSAACAIGGVVIGAATCALLAGGARG